MTASQTDFDSPRSEKEGAAVGERGMSCACGSTPIGKLCAPCLEAMGLAMPESARLTADPLSGNECGITSEMIESAIHDLPRRRLRAEFT